MASGGDQRRAADAVVEAAGRGTPPPSAPGTGLSPALAETLDLKSPVLAATLDGKSPTPAVTEDGHGPALAETAAGEPAGGSTLAALQPGVRLAGRYLVVRRLGRGGMGEVYEVDDLALHEHVALKIVRPEIAGEPGAVARFRREIHLARKVTHPNVCRIFDIGFDHQLVDGREVQIVFLTMELLAGETLAERLDQRGRISTEEALPLLEQMAAGLDAAHRAGIVHRDFKSANVLLVPSKDGAPRAVVTDFGLARGGERGEQSSVTHGSGLVGTPAYMAPEQVNGTGASPASDVYALGVILYQMVTGTLPFVGDTAISTAIKRLTEPPPPPRKLIPDLDRQWEATILRCLERDPTQRFQSGAEVVRALGEEPMPLPRRRTPWIVMGAVALLALAGGGVLFARRGKPAVIAPPATSVPLPAPRRSVAVLGLKNLSGRAESAWLSTAFAEMLATELGGGPKLRTISGAEIARMKAELKLGESESLGRDSLGLVRANLGADLIVLGSYIAMGRAGESIRIDLRLQDATSGEIVAATAETGRESDLFDIVARGGRRLREALGVGEAGPAVAAAVRNSLPANPEAARFYVEGLAKLRRFDALGARPLLEKAIQLEGSFPLAYNVYAEALTRLGDELHAGEAAKRAHDLAKDLRREERLLVEARSFQASGQSERAIELYRTLFEFVPDEIDYGLLLAEAQSAAGHGSDALATVAQLRKLPSFVSEDTRIDLAEAVAAEAMADFPRVRKVVARAAPRAAQHRQWLLVMRFRHMDAWAAVELGELEQAITLARETRQLAMKHGDVVSEAWALSTLGGVEIFRGNHANAKLIFSEEERLVRRGGYLRELAATLVNLARAEIESGHLREGLSRIEELESFAPRAGMSEPMGVAALARGWIHRHHGDLGNAAQSFARAQKIFLDSGNVRMAPWPAMWSGIVALERDQLPDARIRLQGALDAKERAHLRFVAADRRIALARLVLEEGNPASAEKLFRSALELYEQTQAGDGRRSALATLSRALREQKRLDEARPLIAHAAAAPESESPEIRVAVAVEAARVRAAAGGNLDDVARSLDGLIVEMTRLELIPLVLEARLARQEIGLKRGDSSARHEIAQLAREAKRRGLGLLARRASVLLAG